MKSLVYTVIGDERVFHIDIDERKFVWELVNIIKVVNPMTNGLEANELELFLAKQDGKWLKEGDHDKENLQQGSAIGGVFESAMKLNFLVGDSSFDFPDKGSLHENDIHVLVRFREAANNTIPYARVQKRKRFVHSQVGSTEGQQLLKAMNISVRPVRALPIPVGPSSMVAPFEWNPSLSQEDQRGRYQSYVESNIGREVLGQKRLCVYCAHDNEILNAKVPGRDIHLSGDTDLLILSASARDCSFNLKFLPDAKMVIEVKMEVGDEDEYQTLSELVALDLRTDNHVVALVCDLRNTWRFFWFSEKIGDRVIVHNVTIGEPCQAFEMIKSILLRDTIGEVVEVSDDLSGLERPAKRRKLIDMLSSANEDRKCDEDEDDDTATEHCPHVASSMDPKIEVCCATSN